MKLVKWSIAIGFFICWSMFLFLLGEWTEDEKQKEIRKEIASSSEQAGYTAGSKEGYFKGYSEGIAGIIEFGKTPLYIGYYEGNSMVQKGLDNIHQHYFYYKEECNVGDFCGFTCEKCKNENGDTAYLKEVTKKKDGCFWFEGNKYDWQENGEWYESRDSRSYGWVCEGEYTDMQRVVR